MIEFYNLLQRLRRRNYVKRHFVYYFIRNISQLKKMREAYAAEHLAFCKSIGLKGRISIADEGNQRYCLW